MARVEGGWAGKVIMLFRERPAWVRYSVAVVATAVGFALRWALKPILGAKLPYATLYPAVAFSASFGGGGPGALATVISAVAMVYEFLPPAHSPAIDDWPDIAGMVLFVVMALFIAALTEAMRRAHASAEANARLAEERLRQFEAHQQWASVTLSSIGDAVAATDRDGKLTFMNPEAERLTCWPHGTWRGLPIGRVMRIEHEHTRQRVENPVERVLREGAVVGLANHCILVREDGSAVPIDDSGAPIRDKQGQITGAVIVFRDITDRKRVEQELLRQAEDLARSNTELQQFAYVASHDLQEPLRNITAFAQLLERRFGERLESDAREFLSHIVSSALRMGQLVRDLLAYSRVADSDERGAESLLSEAVRTALLQLNTLIKETGATVELSELPPVRGDGAQLTQLFQNLISNAIKYRSDKPPLVLLNAEPHQGGWIVSVHDNGVGVPPRYREHIFGMFKRLHTIDHPGTGIGLAICRKVVERHGGRIWCEANPQGGSIFRFFLPAGAHTSGLPGSL